MPNVHTYTSLQFPFAATFYRTAFLSWFRPHPIRTINPTILLTFLSFVQVLTVNGARVLDDVVPATSGAAEDSFSFDEVSTGSVQQRRDMVLSPSGTETAEGTRNQQIIAIGHAVDRVLFPLPVGDVLATMRADRQRRYTVFLRAVDDYCSPSVRTLLTGKY